MKPTLNTSVLLAWLTLAMAFSINAYAAEQAAGPSDKPDKPQHREPPPQAYQDCKGRQAGDVVQITTPREEHVSATCTNSPKGLFARPDRPPGDRENSGKNQNK